MAAQMICTNCYLRGTPKNYTRGNAYIKVMTWPLSTFARYQGCPGCGAENMVPISSPRGQELVRIADAFKVEHPDKSPTLKPGDEIYYSEGGRAEDVGWFIELSDDGSLLGPFATKEDAERAERGAPPVPQPPISAPIEDIPAPPGPRFRTRDEYEAWKASKR